MSAVVVAGGAGVLGAALLFVGARSLARRRREARFGALVAVETDGTRPLRSERYRLSGRPDELRRTPDGALVPVEWKRREAPHRGAFYSHTVQLWAYCLLLEETTGRPPPYGVLRYRDREELVPWNGAARAALLELRRRALAPYDGAADPSPGKCARCAFAFRCDVSAARGPAGPRLAAASSTAR